MRLTGFTVLVLAVTAPALAVRPPERVWGPAVRRIQEAARITDEHARENALRAAVRSGLITFNREISDETFTFLSENSRWIDLHPVSDVLEEFASSNPHCRGLGLLDDNELARASLPVRKELYRRAIEKGAARMNRGSGLARESAIMLAAFEGMADLRPLIDQYAGSVEPRWKEALQFNSIPALLELTEGASDRDTAAEKAATRLAAIDDKTLRTRMENDEGFRAAVTRLTDYLCARNPLTGGVGEGCRRVKEILERQTALEARMESSRGRVPAFTGVTDRRDWLERWKERVE